MSEERVILVTGSSRGIGAGLAVGFAQAGFRVVINYAASAAEAEQVRREIGEERALAIQADVSQRGDVQAMFERIDQVFGRVDVLINNAGINRDGPFMEMTDAQWDRVLATNLTGTFICSQEFARRYTGDEGHIINMGATTAFRGRKNGANYCSAKAGIVTLTKCMALELAPRIRVNCIIPGLIDTEELRTRYHLDEPERLAQMVGTVPMGRLGTPDDMFRMISFIVCDSEYITGQNFFVNGGYVMI